MDAEVTGAEGAGSPTATAEPNAQPTGALNPDTNGQNGAGQTQTQTVPYERFQQVNARMRQYEQAYNQVNARLQQLERAREGTGKPESDEERALKDARDAFYGKVAPELKGVPEMLQGMAQDRFVTTGERMIEAFAKEHGLTAADLSNSLADIIKSDPALMARAQKGDVSLVSQYLRGLTPVVSSFKKQSADAQRAAATTVGQSKTALTKLPPRVTGGVPGGVALPKPVAGDTASQRAATSARHGLMRRMVDEMTG